MPHGHRLVVLDTTDSAEESYQGWQGRLGRVQARWLRRTLKRHDREHIVGAVHHPPFQALPFTQALRFAERDARRVTRALATAGTNVLGALCDHFHLATSSSIGNLAVHATQALVEHPHRFWVLTWHPGGCRMEWHLPVDGWDLAYYPPRHRVRGRIIQGLGAVAARQRSGARSITRPVVMRRW